MNSFTKWYIQRRQEQHNKENKEIYKDVMQGKIIPGQIDSKVQQQHSHSFFEKLDDSIYKWNDTLKSMSKIKKFGISLIICAAMYIPYELSQYEIHKTTLVDLVKKHYWLHYTQEGKAKLERMNQTLQLK